MSMVHARVLCVALAALGLGVATPARAEVAVMDIDVPANRVPQRYRRATGAMARRIRPPRVPVGPPPVREVRTALRQMDAAVQACGDQYEPPGRGRNRRLRVRVWLNPTGAWTMEVPELDRGGARRSHAALRSCLRAAVASRIQRHMRRFRGRARQKVERSFRVRMPGPPPSAAQLGRQVTRARTRLVQCVPGASTGRQGNEVEMTVRGTLETTGQLTLTGVGVPDGVPFDAVAGCVQTALRQIAHERVSGTRSFETTIRFRMAAPTPPPPTQGPL